MEPILFILEPIPPFETFGCVLQELLVFFNFFYFDIKNKKKIIFYIKYNLIYLFQLEIIFNNFIHHKKVFSKIIITHLNVIL